MNLLYELTSSLNEEEQKMFRKYHTHKSRYKGRKDIQVFNEVCQNGSYNSKEVVAQLYGDEKESTKNAHRMLRLRIKKSIEDFIHQQVQKDDTPIYLNKLISIAHFLYFRKKYVLSWHYLEKAENIAKEAEEYELLNQVYHYMIKHAWTHPPYILEALIQKERDNQTAAQDLRSMNLALSVIHNQLNAYNSKVEKPNIQKIVQEALKRFNVQKMLLQSASQYYKLAMIVKVSLEEKKEYEELSKYMINIINEMEAAKLFTKYNYQYRVELLNVVCYSSARAGDYATAEKYIQIIEEENKIYPETDLFLFEVLWQR